MMMKLMIPHHVIWGKKVVGFLKARAGGNASGWDVLFFALTRKDLLKIKLSDRIKFDSKETFIFVI